MTYGRYGYYGCSIPQGVSTRVRQLEIDAKIASLEAEKQARQIEDNLWNAAVANLTSHLESINDYQA